MSDIPDDIKAISEALFAPYSYLADGPNEEDVAELILAERQRCAAFARAKHDWPPRWIAASIDGENSAYTDFKEPKP